MFITSLSQIVNGQQTDNVELPKKWIDLKDWKPSVTLRNNVLARYGYNKSVYLGIKF